jgi:signal transduction histidine kinase
MSQHVGKENAMARAAWQGWPAVIVVIGLALSGSAWVYFERLGQMQSRMAFEAQARDRVALIEHTFERAVDAVTVIADLLRVQPEIPAADFERFGQYILARQPIFSSLGYSEWTPADRLGELVARMRIEGYPLDHVTVRPASGGDYVPAPPDGEARLVLTRLTPPPLGRMLVGLDVASLPDRRDTVLAARDEGKLRMTGPLPLGGRPPDEAGVLLFMPTYRGDPIPATLEERRQAFAGAASIGLLIEPMLRHMLAAHHGGWVRTVVVDGGDDSSGGTLLFDQLAPGAKRLETDLEALARHPLASWQTLEVGGRAWQVLSTPTPWFLAHRQTDFAPLLALVLGGTITLLAALLASFMLRHDRAMRGHLAEREAVAEKLAQANAALVTANREMEEFVSAVSHDLRNPLHAITLAGHLLQMGLERGDPAVVQRGAESLGRSTSTMTRIVHDLLEHSRAGWAPAVHEVVDFNDLVRRLVAERAEAIEACRARIDVLTLPTIVGDPGRLSAALDNLLDNALKHAAAVPGDGEPWIRIGPRVTEEEIGIFVSDNGPGIPEEHRQRVFKLFQRLSKTGDGSGLGLAIVARVARGHGGRAWVEETPGGGTTVVMSFPRGRTSPPG